MDISKIIAVDMDGTLSKQICWTPEQCLNAEPNMTIVNMVKKIERSNFVIIHTARRDELIPATLQWLRKHNIRFQAISNNKMAADVYIDDKCYNPFGKINEDTGGI